ncbi:MAG: hypothetical protein AAGB14_08590 [Verrucomicrobiota bacterium]
MKIVKATFSLLAASTLSVQAVSLLQVETFDSPTGWTSGNPNPNPPQINPVAGPGGIGDPGLLVSSSVGSSAGSRLVTFNTTDWTGNYSGAGVTALSMDLRNTGSDDLFVRIAVNGPGGWFVTDSQEVGSGLGYATFLFDITPVSLSPAQDRSSPLGNDVDATLASVTQARILHNATGGLAIGAVANAELRIDNITAVPEPKVPVLVGLALLFCIKRKVRLQEK